MATPRKHWFRVADSVLREGWDNDALAALVRLMAHLNQRWARDGIDRAEAGRATLGPTDIMLISGRRRADVARKSLERLSDFAGISIEHRGDFLEIDWPKFPEFQWPDARLREEDSPRASPSSPSPSSSPSPKKKRESTPFGRGASPPAGEQASLVPDSPPDPSDPFDPDRLADVLGAEGREAKRAFVREHLDHLLAAARARLAERGVEEPTRAQVRAALLERLHAFWKQRAKGPRGVPDDDTPSERETRWLKEAQARWLRKHGS